MNAREYILRFWNLWPPYLFSGIRVKVLSKDYRHIKTTLKLRFLTANYVGTQYGGSLFSMTDPQYMLMLIKNLGPDYVVWDKETTIRYLQPGRTHVSAEFFLSEEDLAAIRATVQEQGKMLWKRTIAIKDLSGNTIAEVDKTISIKKRTSSHAT